MNFYRRRPLALVFTLCIATFAVCAFLAWYAKLVLLLVTAAIVPISVFLLNRREILHICNIPAKTFVSMTAAFVMSAVLLCVGYYDVYIEQFSSLGEGEISAVVTDIENGSSYSETYAVRIITYNGRKYHGKGLLRFDSSPGLSAGDVIRADVGFVPLEDFYSFTTSSRISLLSSGCVFAADVTSEPVLEGEMRTMESTFVGIRRTVSAKLSLYLGRESANIVRALFLGERDDIGVLERDFKYTGTSHLLALSGMHLAVLTMAAEALLKKLSLPRKLRCFAIVALTLSYAAMTGFLMSVLRAAIMMSVYHIAGCTREESDRVTALFGAAWLIVSVNPAAVFDVGLQLSFFATLGVVLMLEASDRNEGRGYFVRTGLLKRTADELGRSSAVSLGALFFILPLQWIYFGGASTMSVPATLLLSPLCSGILMLTLPYLLFATLRWRFAAAALAGAIDAVYTVMAHVARVLSKHAKIVWLGYPFALPIFMCTVAVLAYMAWRKKYSWVHALVPMCTACALFFICVLMNNVFYSTRVTLDYSSEGKSDALLLVSSESSILVDCSDGTASAATLVADALGRNGVSELDVLVLGELTRRHIGEACKLLSACRIGCIVVPTPSGEDELYLLHDISRIAEEFGALTRSYDRADYGCEVYIAGACITFAPAVKLARSERELIAFSADISGVKIAYLGACSWENERVWSIADAADYVIVGRHGPNIKGGPSDSIEHEKRLVFISGDEKDIFDNWLSGYTGRVRFGDRLRIVIDP